MKAVVLGKLVIEKPKLRYVSEEESQARLDSAGIKHLRYLRDQSTDNLRLSDDCVRRASKALQDDLMSISGIENNTVDDILRVVMLSTIKTEKEDDVPSGWDPFTVRFGEFRMERRRKRRPPSLPLKVWDDSHHSYSYEELWRNMFLFHWTDTEGRYPDGILFEDTICTFNEKEHIEYFEMQLETPICLIRDDSGNTRWAYKGFVVTAEEKENDIGIPRPEYRRLSQEEKAQQVMEAVTTQEKRVQKLSKLSSLENRMSKAAKRQPISDEVRMFVWQRDKGRCVQCGSNEKLVFDHIIPAAKGGSNTQPNLQLLCELCKKTKSDSI
ncbi:MAG: HNH endonuclease [SAR202 cluster bacterium]|nr:HNH endonuclease [SAR202 cluster bacterium]